MLKGGRFHPQVSVVLDEIVATREEKNNTKNPFELLYLERKLEDLHVKFREAFNEHHGSL